MSPVPKPAKPKRAPAARARKPAHRKKSTTAKPRKPAARSTGNLVSALARALGSTKSRRTKSKQAARRGTKRAAAKGAIRRPASKRSARPTSARSRTAHSRGSTAAASRSRVSGTSGRPAARRASAKKSAGRPKSALRKTRQGSAALKAKRRPAVKTAKKAARRQGTGAAAAKRVRTRSTAKRPAARRSGVAASRTTRRLPARATARRSFPKAGATSHATKNPGVRVPFRAYSGTKPYIFVSYAHHNMNDVFSILRRLDESRFRMWYDEGIEPGNEWPEVVGKAVLGCSQLLVFMSRSAARSRNVRNEVNLAFSSGKNIVVVYLEKTSLSEGMRLQVGSVQSLNWFEIPREEFLDRIKKVLQNVAPTKG